VKALVYSLEILVRIGGTSHLKTQMPSLCSMYYPFFKGCRLLFRLDHLWFHVSNINIHSYKHITDLVV